MSAEIHRAHHLHGSPLCSDVLPIYDCPAAFHIFRLCTRLVSPWLLCTRPCNPESCMLCGKLATSPQACGHQAQICLQHLHGIRIGDAAALYNIGFQHHSLPGIVLHQGLYLNTGLKWAYLSLLPPDSSSRATESSFSAVLVQEAYSSVGDTLCTMGFALTISRRRVALRAVMRRL